GRDPLSHRVPARRARRPCRRAIAGPRPHPGRSRRKDLRLGMTYLVLGYAAAVLLLGGGVAAHGAVSGRRRAGSTDLVLVLGREADPPYQRPPLSKRYLLGEVEREELMLPPLEAELRLG